MAEKPDVSKLDKVLEGYKPIPMKRLFYPRGMKLSEEFVNAFHREYDRLLGEGQNPKTLVERFGKAMKFHKNEARKYHQLDEEKAAQELEEKKNTEKLKEETGDRRTNEGDHPPGKEGGGQDGHRGIGREVTRTERDKRKRTGKKQPKFGKGSEHEDFVDRQAADQS